jgi:polysaccharide pyruvyl transferase CsaB
LLKLAKFLGKPYAFFAQGLGPFTRKGSKAKVGESAKGARLLSVRDGQSRQLLRELGAGPVELVADPVWALPADQLAAEAPLREPYILFALRPWQGKEERLCGALEKLRRESRLPFVFAAMQPQCDLPLARRLAAELGGEVAAASDLPALLGYFAQAQLVCAMRLHALIFAALLQRPAVAISYDPKVDALVEELGLAGADLEAPDLEAAVSQATAARPEQVRELKARAASGLEGLAQLGRKLDGES